MVRAGGGRLRHLVQQLGRVGIVTFGLIFTCAYVAFSAEKGTNPEFANFGDSVWWAAVTVTTVGYGDITPITLIGRISAVVPPPRRRLPIEEHARPGSARPSHRHRQPAERPTSRRPVRSPAA